MFIDNIGRNPFGGNELLVPQHRNRFPLRIKQINRSKGHRRMRTYTKSKTRSIHRLISKPKNKGPRFSLQGKTKLWLKSQPLTTHRQIKYRSRFPQGKHRQYRNPIIRHTHRTRNMIGCLKAILYCLLPIGKKIQAYSETNT